MDKIISLYTRLHCSVHDAFEKFTVDTALESWLTQVADVEPVVGGKYELFWNPADRENNSTIGCKITALEKDKFLSFEWRSPEQFKHFANQVDPLTHVVVFFIPDGKWTEVRLIHTGWRSTPEWQEACQWQEKAWQMAFGELEKQINF
ncbi:MAG: SRPBCC domain-containing protein [Anaerolineaceae bacterium]|nr:SRPBCC domain-containing protein [Anaerolineaceae bacterium]